MKASPYQGDNAIAKNRELMGATLGTLEAFLAVLKMGTDGE